MRQQTLSIALKAMLLFFVILFHSQLYAQVKIGGDPKRAPDASAILELDDPAKGLLLPRISNENMLKIKKPADGLLIYNVTEKKIFIYSESLQEWKAMITPMPALEANGTGEWHFDTTTNRVYLTRGLPIGDTIYYNVEKKKFVFADKLIFAGANIPVDVQFPGKYIFKGTASQLFNDSVSVSFPSMTLTNILYEVDNDPFAVSNNIRQTYNGLRVSTQSTNTATQKISNIRALNLQVNSVSQDTVFGATGVVLNTFATGAGYTNTYSGYQTNMNLGDSASGNFGNVFGNRILMARRGNSSSKINGSLYGYHLTMGGFEDSTVTKINGSAYGVFLNNITGAAPKRNYAFYSNKGHNRFGDSVLVTDQFITSPRAVFDINATSAMIVPNGNTLQRPSVPVQAMVRYNNSFNNLELYDGAVWKGLVSDSAEWKFDAATNRVFLTKGYPNGDSIFYNRPTKQFLFADKTVYHNSLGTDINALNFGGKFMFKATASGTDSAGLFNPSAIYAIMEADNGITNGGRSFTGINAVALANPKRVTPVDIITGVSSAAINTGRDSVYTITGITNLASVGNTGYTGVVTGFSNNTQIRNTSTQNIDVMYGIRNNVSRNTAATSSVNGNVYGYFGLMGNFNQRVNGSAYGIFLSSVINVAGPGKNFALYSNKGVNRLGDSTLITDGAAVTPRAVLDVNATSAMIVPTGTTAQRPTTPVTGMVRYNTDNGGRLETFNGAAWIGTINGGIGLDIINLLPNTGTTTSFAFTGATVGSAVVISPSSALPAGIIIAWARVSAANTIEVRFENNAAFAVNPPSIGFNVKVIQ